MTEKILLSNFIEQVRDELVEANAKFLASGSSNGFSLDEVILEVQIVTELSGGRSGKAQFFVLTVDASTTKKSSSIQKVTLKLKPSEPIMMGLENEQEIIPKLH